MTIPKIQMTTKLLLAALGVAFGAAVIGYIYLLFLWGGRIDPPKHKKEGAGDPRRP